MSNGEGLAALAGLVVVSGAALIASHRGGGLDGLEGRVSRDEDNLAAEKLDEDTVRALLEAGRRPKARAAVNPLPPRPAPRALAPPPAAPASHSAPIPVDVDFDEMDGKNLPVPADLPKWLRTFDVILINTSAGKDSQAMLDYVYELAVKGGVQDRIVAVHCDLGRIEWEGTKALARLQAEHYGLRFEVVRRDRDLLQQVEHERKKWPSNACRYCTSDHKTSQVVKLITKLVAEKLAAVVRLGRPVRILNCLGLRADESPSRAKKPPLSRDGASNSKREVIRWLPIHRWTEAQVWAQIRKSGVEHHYAYDLGMPRLSCCFCVLASKSALMLAVQHNPALADEYIRVERAIGHRFTDKYSFEDVVEAARKAKVVKVDAWVG